MNVGRLGIRLAFVLGKAHFWWLIKASGFNIARERGVLTWCDWRLETGVQNNM